MTAAPSAVAIPSTSPSVSNHDVTRVVTELKGKLAARSRHVCVFLGAGASRSAGLPDLKGLENSVRTALSGSPPQLAALNALLTGRNLEQALSRLRRIKALVAGGGTFDGLDAASATALDAAICSAIVAAVSTPTGNGDAFVRLAHWLARGEYHNAIEVFTVNYDLLVEHGLETAGAPFFDGFVGTLKAPFRADLVENLDASDRNRLPAGFIRLWKLHGSINWVLDSAGPHHRVIRSATPPGTGSTVAIFPSEEKYDDSRRVPFVVLMDRFRRALAEPETVTLVSGYSFSDEHLNELMFTAAQRHPRSELVVFCYADIPNAVRAEAQLTPNITVLARREGIVGGVAKGWAAPADIPEIFVGGEQLLGDFAKLTTYLTTERITPNVVP